MTSPHEQALAAAMDAKPFNSELTVRAMLEQGGAGYATLESAIFAYLAALPAPDLAEWEKAAEGVTPGPWTTERGGGDLDWRAKFPSPDQALIYALEDCDIHPVADASCNHTCRGSWDCEANAEWIARCSPDNVLSALRSLSARLAEAERELDTKAKLYRQALRRAKAAEARASSLAAELNEARANVGNLLARIHRDGGHYAARHGTAKAVADADLIVAELFARKETPDAQ